MTASTLIIEETNEIDSLAAPETNGSVTAPSTVTPLLTSIKQPPQTISATVFDSQHKQVEVLSLYPDLAQQTLDTTALPPLSYVKIGNGDTIFFTTDLNDAACLHSLDLEQTTTIAPVHSAESIEVAQIIKTNLSDGKFVLFSQHQHRAMVQTIRDTLEAAIFYPSRNFDSWATAIATQGADEISTTLISRMTASATSGQFAVTDQHVQNIEAQWSIFDNLIINQHIAVICAAPNAGKTTIMNWVCAQVSDLVDIQYVNVDCSGSDLKAYFDNAQEGGFQMINFDVAGSTQEEFFTALIESPSLHGQLFVLDTFKQFADLMNKASVKAFMRLLRQLCNKGATFVVLAHTNKHLGKDGLPVFEGVGDVRSDCDEMIYLIAENQADGSKIVSTSPDKKRGAIAPLTFCIKANRDVSLTDYVNIQEEKQKQADQLAITAIQKALTNGPVNQSELTNICKLIGLGKSSIRRVLKQYLSGDKPLWLSERGAKNALLYRLNDGTTP
ncbi:MAG: hypothetical protein ACJAZ7_000178 [Zhongshania aliphaticivorans]|jgi:hypothetical protein